MIGIDTNLVVRLVVDDDAKQTKAVVELIKNHPVFISKSVLLEAEWVLRYSYHRDAKTILAIFKELLGNSEISVEDPLSVTQALKWFEKGFDFADALHLASSHRTEKFATFDKDFIKKAKKLNIHLLTLKA